MSISAHEDRRHRCHLCGKGFIYPHKLQEHLNTHTGDKPFKCKFCNAAFASSSNKRMHERAHLGIKVKQSKKQQQWIKKKKREINQLLKSKKTRQRNQVEEPLYTVSQI